MRLPAVAASPSSCRVPPRVDPPGAGTWRRFRRRSRRKSLFPPFQSQPGRILLASDGPPPCCDWPRFGGAFFCRRGRKSGVRFAAAHGRRGGIAVRRAAASIQGRLAWRLGLLFVVVFLGALVLTFARYRAGDLEVPTRLVQKHVSEIIAALKVGPDGRLTLAWTRKTPSFDYVVRDAAGDVLVGSRGLGINMRVH